MKKWVAGLILVVFMLMCLGGALADPNLSLMDYSVRSGSWVDAYAAILAERSSGIQAYQDYVLSITSIPACSAVDLLDLTGDGVPELLFLELVNENEYGFTVGRLWVYTSDSNGVHCALTLQPEIDDLLYSRYYCTNHGLLTLRFSDCEMSWTLQMRLDPGGHFVTETTLIEEPDFSGESPDLYYLNGKKISEKKYQSLITEIQSSPNSLIGSMMIDDGYSGFSYTLAEAQNALSSGTILQEYPNTGNGAGSSGGQFPALSFFMGSFTPGQKFPVYSAPSTRSWRGANGKAAITSGSEIYVAGTEGSWILILYELDSGVIRVGYIDSQKINGQYTSGNPLVFSHTEMALAKATEIFDDPIRQTTTIGKLKKGTKVTCLAEYRGWIYVETKVSGKVTRGFIAPSSLGLED